MLITFFEVLFLEYELYLRYLLISLEYYGTSQRVLKLEKPRIRINKRTLGTVRENPNLFKYRPDPQSPEGLLPQCKKSRFILCKIRKAVVQTSWVLSPSFIWFAYLRTYTQGSEIINQLSLNTDINFVAKKFLRLVVQ